VKEAGGGNETLEARYAGKQAEAGARSRNVRAIWLRKGNLQPRLSLTLLVCVLHGSHDVTDEQKLALQEPHGKKLYIRHRYFQREAIHDETKRSRKELGVGSNE